MLDEAGRTAHQRILTCLVQQRLSGIRPSLSAQSGTLICYLGILTALVDCTAAQVYIVTCH